MEKEDIIIKKLEEHDDALETITNERPDSMVDILVELDHKFDLLIYGVRELKIKFEQIMANQNKMLDILRRWDGERLKTHTGLR